MIQPVGLHHPAPFHDLEAAAVRSPVDDFDVDSEGGAVLDGGILETGVDPALRAGRVRLLRLVEEADSQGVL
jgi:hypothetical protein